MSTLQRCTAEPSSGVPISCVGCLLAFALQGKFGLKLFQSLNPDPKLLGELYSPLLQPPMAPPEPPLSVVLTRGKPEKGAEDEREEDGRGHVAAKGESEESLADQLVFEMRVAAPPVSQVPHPL